MSDITIRELRNRGGVVLNRVTRGEILTVTRDGRPIAQLRPLPHPPLPAATLLSHWHGLPRVDAAKLKADIDNAVNPSM